MFKLQFGLEGVDELFAALDEREKNINRAVKTASLKGAKIIVKAIKDKTPMSEDGHYNSQLKIRYKPGNLKKSIGAKALKQTIKGKQVILIGPRVGKYAKNDGWYGRLVAKGTSKQAPNPFFDEAVAAAKEKALTEMVNEYGKAIDGNKIDEMSGFFDDITDLIGGD